MILTLPCFWILAPPRSITKDISSSTTHIISPLGGSLYILVPYKVELGVITVSISGGVIVAPFFQRTHFNMMTKADWLARRDNPAPWVDFETDSFMLTLPSALTFAYDDPTTVLDTVRRAFEPEIVIHFPLPSCGPSVRQFPLMR